MIYVISSTVKSLIKPHQILKHKCFLSCSCLNPIHWSQVLSREWRCDWGNADKPCSSYICGIRKIIAYWCATYIRYLTAYLGRKLYLKELHWSQLREFRWQPSFAHIPLYIVMYEHSSKSQWPLRCDYIHIYQLACATILSINNLILFIDAIVNFMK